MVGFKTIFTLIVAMLLVLPVPGAVLDWSSVSWTAGSLSNTYDVDGDSMNDVTITISGDTSAFVAGYPTISTALQGGLGSADQGLELRLNFTNPSQSITVTFTFLNDYLDAKDVSFSLFDIDADQVGASSNNRYRDHLDDIMASGDNGLIAPSLTGGAATVVAGSGTNQTATGNDDSPDTGAGSGAGNVNVSFGTNYINEFSFTLGNTGNILAGNPQEQVVGIHNVNFKKSIPEVGTTLMAVTLCVGVAGWRLIRLRRQGNA